MDELTTGMQVRSMDDRSLGQVYGINTCCFEFVLWGGDRRSRATEAAIFQVRMGVVTLICLAAEIARYDCRMHSTAAV